jgi:hypothetical protein
MDLHQAPGFLHQLQKDIQDLAQEDLGCVVGRIGNINGADPLPDLLKQIRPRAWQTNAHLAPRCTFCGDKFIYPRVERNARN